MEKGLPYHGETRSTAAVGKTEHAAGAGDTAAEGLRPGALDTVEFGSADSGAVSEEAVMDCLRILERDYPGMNVVIWEREGAGGCAGKRTVSGCYQGFSGSDGTGCRRV